MSYEYLNRAPLGIPTWAPPMMGFGQDQASEGAEPALAIEPTPKQPTVPVETVLLPTVEDPLAVISKKQIVQMSDAELTDRLNKEIIEGWRLKSCDGVYCEVQAERSYMLRSALLADYRRRQMEREMPPIKEPIHTLAYGRYKLSKAVISWSNSTLTARMLWPVRVYLKAGATALEDAVASKYLTVFIISSPVIGYYTMKRLGFTGWTALLLGGYLGMTAGALLPMTLFGLAQALGAAEEKDFLWAVS
jgi:hypothetical protein